MNKKTFLVPMLMTSGVLLTSLEVSADTTTTTQQADQSTKTTVTDSDNPWAGNGMPTPPDMADGQRPSGAPEGGGMPGGPGQEKQQDPVGTYDDTVSSDYQVDESTQGDAKDGDYEKIFESDFQDININISEQNLDYLKNNAILEPDVLATSIEIDGKTLGNISVGTKGNTSLSSVVRSDSDKYSFSVDLGEYMKDADGNKQNLYGLQKFSLNNNFGDPTAMKEYLSYQLMHEMGVNAPYATLVRLSINGQYYGLYTMTENINSDIAERTTGDDDGLIAKPQNPGGSLGYDSALDEYRDADGHYDLDYSTYQDKDNPLSQYTGLWGRQTGSKTLENYSDLSDKKKAKVTKSVDATLNFMKQLNELANDTTMSSDEYIAALEKIIDPDQLARYFAVNTYLVNLDSYQSQQQQNYGIYINDDGYATIYPWDYNFAFGAFGTRDANAMVNFSISDPLMNTTLDERPLLKVIFNNAELKQKYEDYLSDITKITSLGGTTTDGKTYAANNYSDELDQIYDELETNFVSDPNQTTYDQTAFETAVKNLKTIITDRSTAVSQQVQGNTTTVSTTADLQALGGMGSMGGHRPDQNGEPGVDGQNGMPAMPDNMKQIQTTHPAVTAVQQTLGLNQSEVANDATSV